MNGRRSPSLLMHRSLGAGEKEGSTLESGEFHLERRYYAHREGVMAGFLEEVLLELKAKMYCEVSSPGWYMGNLHFLVHRLPGSLKQKQEMLSH